MSIDWYYANLGDRVGPVTEAEFLALRTSGKVARKRWSGAKV